MVREIRAVRAEAREHETRKGWVRHYPDSPMEDEAFRLHADARDALLRFRDEKPFSMEPEAYLEALRTLFRSLAVVYDMPEPAVRHEGEWEGDSGASAYGSHVIMLRGKRSVLTALHEFAHARGYGETGAVWWSVNAFRTTWPVSYIKLTKKFRRRNGTIRPRGMRHVLCLKGRPVLPVDLTTASELPAAPSADPFDYQEPQAPTVELSAEPPPIVVPTAEAAEQIIDDGPDVGHIVERFKRLDLD